MTRETTVGVVVSCSFLCLVGLVLANKMREGEHKDETVSEEQITSALEEPKPMEGGGQPAVLVPLIASQTPPGEGPQPMPVPTPALSPAPSSSSIVPVGGTSSPPGRVQTDLTAAVGVLDIMRPLNTSGRAGPSERTTAPPPVPPPIVPPKEDPKVSPIGATDKAGSHSTGSFAPDPSGPSVGAFDQAADEKKEKPTSGLSGGPAVTPSTSASGTPREMTPFAPRDRSRDNLVVLPITPAVPGKEANPTDSAPTGAGGPRVSPMPGDSGPKPLDSSFPARGGPAGERGPILVPDPPPPAAGILKKENPSLTDVKAEAGPSDLVPPPVPPPDLPKAGATPVSTALGTGPASSSEGTVKPEPRVNLDRPAVASAPGVAPGIGLPTPPSADDAPDRGIRPVASGTSAQVAQGPSPARALPPIGSPSSALTPALVAPAPTNTGPATTQPQVESFDEETYRVRPGDTFQAISHNHYQTESYAQALVEFNRNHPLTSEADRQNLPLLRVGQSVYIPPTSILEKRYANVLKERSPAPGAGGTATTRDSSASPVPAPAPSRSALSTYQVKAGGGELMFSIAAQKLGDGKRWMEIKELNPSVDFTAPVPAGTTLKLPADARID